jgi:L-fuconolactonase
MRIDAHVTFREPQYMPGLLWPRLESNRFDGCIAHLSESLLHLADQYPWILGCVAPAENAQDLDRLQRHSQIRAISSANVNSLDLFRELQRREIPLEINTDLDSLRRILDAAPSLRVATRARSGLRPMGGHLFVKLAGDIGPLVKEMFDAFGPAQILFGSDWPECLERGTWKQTLATFTQAIGAQTMDARSLMLGENAMTFYGNITSGK